MTEPHAPSNQPSLREAAVEVVESLRNAGHVAYFAGGCVRDRLLSIEPKDYDVATDARPESVRKIFPRAMAVGEAFGVLLVRRHGWTIEIATFRTDGRYDDGRHPTSVEFTDAEHDAQRRDFTINGLFEDPISDTIIDFVDGRADLERGVIRAIGSPAERLAEDELRMLRAIRFAARFGFSIEPHTAEAIRTASAALRGVSRERIGQEIRWMFEHPNRGVAAWELQYLNLDEATLDESHVQSAPMRLGALPQDAAYATALAAWMLDRHSEDALDDLLQRAQLWQRSLMLSNADYDALRRCLEQRETVYRGWPTLGVAKQKRLAASTGFNDTMKLIRAENREVFVEVARRVGQLRETDLAPHPLLDGNDLIEAGLEPGPHFSRILEAVYDAQLEGAINDRQGALEVVRVLLETDPP